MKSKILVFLLSGCRDNEIGFNLRGEAVEMTYVTFQFDLTLFEKWNDIKGRN